MDWKRKLASRCEIELQEIRRLWGRCEDILEWSNENDALDDWHDGDRQVFALVIAFQDQFSFLHCLERECRKIDHLLSDLDETTNPSSPSFRPGAPSSGIDAYDLSYFSENPQRWSIKFNTWHANLFVTDRSLKDTKMEDLVVSETANFALLESLQEALEDSIQLWNVWGTASFDIQDGIKARIRALSFLRERYGDSPPRLHDFSIAEIREDLRTKQKTKAKNENADLRLRKRRPTKDTSVGVTHNEGPEELQMGTAEAVPLPSTDDKESPRPAISTLIHLVSRVRDLCRLKGVRCVPKVSDFQMVPKRNGLFSILAVTAFVLSTWFVSLSITKSEDFWAGISQMILFVFQAYCAYGSRRKSRKHRGDEENRHTNVVRTSDYFFQYMVAGALSAIVSAFVYPYHAQVSTGFSFVATLCQVAGIISIHNATDAADTNHH